ncbi:ScbR family autoregulator-binding transcription factor [Streptomyces sp. NPDC059255]|uniref:ScbR family autoregulator-binding transcription factor n=1 Tax=Streptomyces sp. NPDC059255 TaxID=3346793 RepID=UPI00369FEA47
MDVVLPRTRAKQERSIRTRALLLAAAGEVFYEHGYAATTLKTIYERTGSTKGRLYHHFDSKADLAIALLTEQVPMATVPPQESKIQELIDTGFHFVDLMLNNSLIRGSVRLSTDGGLPQEINAAPTFHQWAQHVEQVLTQAQKSGQMLPGATPSEVAKTLIGSFVGIQLMSKATDDRTSLPVRLSELWKVTLPGIAAPGMLLGLDIAPDRLTRLKLTTPLI